METQQTGADKKAGKWFTQSFEKWLTPKLVPLVPKFIETYHLTMMTVLWSFLVLFSSYKALGDIRWLWLSSLAIVCQYITDLLDGSVGRARNTGLIKWGFYMDHFLDYIFFASIMVGYAFLFPTNFHFIFIALTLIQAGFMVNLFLSFGATNNFKISFLHFGPTETRIIYILFNTFIIFFGVSIPIRLLPYFTIVSALVLCFFVYRTQKDIWKIDMDNKKLLESNQNKDVI